MSVFDRLGDIIKSYLNDENDRIFGKSREPGSTGDPDLDAAYDELNDYLNREKRQTASGNSGTAGEEKKQEKSRNSGYGSYTDYMKEEFTRRKTKKTEEKKQTSPKIPETLRNDFSELGLEFGASMEECKTSYKTLLKKHHPDRHAGHERNMKKATEKSARLNVSYRRIEKWYETGKLD